MEDRPDPYQWVADNSALCYHICHKVCRERPDLVEDMFSEVILERIARVVETWEPDRGPLAKRVAYTMRRYGIAWLRSRWSLYNVGPAICKENKNAEVNRDKAKVRTIPENYNVLQEDTTWATDGQDRIYYIMNRLDGYQRRIVSLHLFEGFSLPEIAGKVGVSRKVIAKHYREALAICRATIDEGS